MRASVHEIQFACAFIPVYRLLRIHFRFVSFRFVAGFLRPCPKNKIQNINKKQKKQEHTKKNCCHLVLFSFWHFRISHAEQPPFISGDHLYMQYIYIWYMYLCFNSVILCSHHFCFIGFRFLFCSAVSFVFLQLSTSHVCRPRCTFRLPAK